MNLMTHGDQGGAGRIARRVLALAGAGVVAACGLAACAEDSIHDESVGYSKTTTTSTIDTPEQRSTVTETRTKDTKVYPR